MGSTGGSDRRESAARAISFTGPEYPTGRISRPFARRNTAGPVSTTDHRRDRRRPECIRCSPGKTWPHEARFSTIHWESEGFYNYCPRDVMLVIGDQIIETPNVIRSRSQETFSYRTMMVEYLKSGAKWYSAPKPMLLDSLFEVDLNKPMPRNDEPAFDAANVLRLGRDLIYLVSGTGNELGGAVAADNFGRYLSGSLPQRCLLWQPY